MAAIFTTEELQKLSLQELRSRAAERKVKIATGLRKKDIIDLLMGQASTFVVPSSETPAIIPGLASPEPVASVTKKRSKAAKTPKGEVAGAVEVTDEVKSEEESSTENETVPQASTSNDPAICGAVSRSDDVEQLSKMNLAELRQLAKARGIKIPKEHRKKEDMVTFLTQRLEEAPEQKPLETMTVKELREKAKSDGIKIPVTAKTKDEIVGFLTNGVGNQPVTTAKVTKSRGKKESDKTLEKFPVSALRTLARERGIKFPSTMKKMEMVVRLMEIIGDKAVTLPVKVEPENIPDPGDLTLLKGKELASFAKGKQIKIPGEITRKKEKADYVRALLNERLAGISRPKAHIYPLDRVQPVYFDGSKFEERSKKTGKPTWQYHLLHHGWTVVPLEDYDAGSYRERFFEFLEGYSPQFRRDDATTWTADNIPCNIRDGNIKGPMGQTSFQWETREKCVQIFATVWKQPESELLSSFDGGCFLPPAIPSHEEQDNVSLLFHTEMPIGEVDFTSIQGLVTLTDSGPEDGGLVIVDRSREFFAEYRSRHPSEGYALSVTDMEDRDLKDLPLLKICAPAGSVILWDSRLSHSNVAPRNGTPFMCLYVSMGARDGATEEELAKRITFYEKNVQTGHACFGRFLKVARPPYRGKAVQQPARESKAELTPARARLIGYAKMPKQ